MGDHRASAVSLAIPADAQYFQLARSVASAVAGRFALPVDVVEDLRLAVTESCNLLVGRVVRARRLTVEVWPDDAALVVQVSTEGSDEAAGGTPSDSLSWTIVTALADDAIWETADGAPRIVTRWDVLADPSA